MTERRLTILQINDLHGYLEPHPEAFRGRGKFNYRTCGGLARIGYPALAPPAQRADFARGEKVYAQNCALCHGADGAGQRT